MELVYGFYLAHGYFSHFIESGLPFRVAVVGKRKLKICLGFWWGIAAGVFWTSHIMKKQQLLRLRSVMEIAIKLWCFICLILIGLFNGKKVMEDANDSIRIVRNLVRAGGMSFVNKSGCDNSCNGRLTEWTEHLLCRSILVVFRILKFRWIWCDIKWTVLMSRNWRCGWNRYKAREKPCENLFHAKIFNKYAISRLHLGYMCATQSLHKHEIRTHKKIHEHNFLTALFTRPSCRFSNFNSSFILINAACAAHTAHVRSMPRNTIRIYMRSILLFNSTYFMNVLQDWHLLDGLYKIRSRVAWKIELKTKLEALSSSQSLAISINCG